MSLAIIQKQNSETYAELRRKVRDTFVTAQKRMEAERVNTYWETGRLIQRYLKDHTEGSKYGKGIMVRLAEDLGVDLTILRRTVVFYKRFPKKAVRPFLSWTHYRCLLTVNDDKQRFALACRAEKQGWNHYQLTEEIQRYSKKKWDERRLPKDKSVTAKLNPPALGPLFHSRIIEETNFQSAAPKLYVDLGFGTHIPVERFDLRKVPQGSIVKSEKTKEGTYHLKKTNLIQKKHLFTYRGYVIRVIDGDTLWMHVDVGFGILKKVKIRLKGINTPKIESTAGKRAKAYLQSLVRRPEAFILKSTRSGKYDRYLGDLFLAETEYVNQMLLDAGHAEIYG